MSSVVELDPSQLRTIADDLLIRFDSAQKLLVGSIADLARATSRSAPDRAEYAKAWLGFSQAGLTRSSAFNSVCDFLRPRVGPDQWTTIAALRAGDTGLRLYSAAHVAEWTNDRIEGDWAGYCLASKGMRMRTGELIHRGRAVLQPLLEQISKSCVNEHSYRDARVIARPL